MNRKVLFVFTAIFGLLFLTLCAGRSSAQASEVKEKPPMLTYVAEWQIPRAHWADLEKTNSTTSAVLEKAMADGTIIGHGHDETLVHQPKGPTHDVWWSSMSMAGLVRVLGQLRSSSASDNALNSATEHWDEVFVSRYYNLHSGPYTGAYTRISGYKFKQDAPENALDYVSQNFVVPLMEKMLADGTVLEYEVDTMAVHTEDPGSFWIAYTTANPEGLDTVEKAIRTSMRSQALAGPAFDSMVDYKGHRDDLIKGDGAYK
jgi:hypothetical protein